MNPGLGLLPFIVFFVIYWFTIKAEFAILGALLFTLIAEPLLRFYTKVSKIGIGFYVVFVSFLLTLIVWILLHNKVENNRLYTILPELFLVIILMVMRFFKSFLSFRFFRKHDAILKIFIHEFFDMASLVQYFFTLHIFLAIIYVNIRDNWMYNSEIDKIVFLLLPAIGVCLIIFYENIRLLRLSQKLKGETWLPIVTNKGEVTGKITKNISVKMKNKFLHPVVRVALVHNGELYLQNRDPNAVLDPLALDHPFEKYVKFKHEIDEAARNSIVQMIGKDLPFNFLLKYTFENDNTKRLIFLYVTRIHDESELQAMTSLHGKFWTMRQIEDDFDDATKFSECFQLEYEYLKNTVLIVDKMVNASDTTTTPEN